MSTQPKVGIIGCGAIAESHRIGYQKNNLIPVAVADVSETHASELAKKCDNAQVFRSFTDLLESGVEAVSICTPPGTHHEIAVAALERGIHVLCEKPLAATLEDCRQIEKAEAASSAVFMVAFRHRYLPVHQAMRALIEKEGLGRIVLFRNLFGGPMPAMKDKWFSKRAIAGGGVLMDTSSHGVDLFRFYCGEIASFAGQTNRLFENTDVEDTGAVVLRSEDGALGIIASSWTIGTWNAIVQIDTEKASLTYDYSNSGEFILQRGADAPKEKVSVKSSDGFAEEITCFLKVIAGSDTNYPSATDGHRVVEVFQGIYSN